MSSITIEEVSTRAELDAIATCIWTVMASSDSMHKICYPVLTDRDTALNDCKARLWKEHTSNQCSHWIFVRESSSSSCAAAPLTVLGACQWRLYTQNPFPHGPPAIEATWWSEGGKRAFATEFIKQCIAPRAAWMARPHAGE